MAKSKKSATRKKTGSKFSGFTTDPRGPIDSVAAPTEAAKASPEELPLPQATPAPTVAKDEPMPEKNDETPVSATEPPSTTSKPKARKKATASAKPTRSHKTTVTITTEAADLLEDIQYELRRKHGKRGVKLNDLYCEALNLLFKKYGKDQVA